MTHRFCVKCGTTIEEGVLCDSCQPEEALKALVVQHCSRCNRAFYRNHWARFPDEETAMQRALKESYKVHATAFEVLPDKKKEHVFNAILKGGRQVRVSVKYLLCDYCNRQHSNYFEGQIQLRSKSAQVLERARKVLEERFSALEARSIYITKIDEHKDGVDLYITSQSVLPGLGNTLAIRLGASITITSKLFSRDNQTQKNLYRVNVLASLPGFVEGEVLEAGKKILLIKQLRRLIKAVDLTKEKAAPFRLQDLKAYEVLQQYNVEALNEIEVLSPEDYQPVKVSNPNKKLDAGKKYDVVVSKQGVFVI